MTSRKIKKLAGLAKIPATDVRRLLALVPKPGHAPRWLFAAFCPTALHGVSVFFQVINGSGVNACLCPDCVQEWLESQEAA